jgi:hypothetical protein
VNSAAAAHAADDVLRNEDRGNDSPHGGSEDDWREATSSRWARGGCLHGPTLVPVGRDCQRIGTRQDVCGVRTVFPRGGRMTPTGPVESPASFRSSWGGVGSPRLPYICLPRGERGAQVSRLSSLPELQRPAVPAASQGPRIVCPLLDS